MEVLLVAAESCVRRPSGARRVKHHWRSWCTVDRVARRPSASRVPDRVNETQHVAFVFVLDLRLRRVIKIGVDDVYYSPREKALLQLVDMAQHRDGRVAAHAPSFPDRECLSQLRLGHMVGHAGRRRVYR